MPRKNNNSTDTGSTESTKIISDLLERQNTELSKISNYLSPDQEERRFQRLSRALIRATSIVAICVSGAFGSWELGVYLKETWEIRELAEDYAEVGLQLYYKENNTTVAKQFLEKALELQPDNSDYLYLDAYIDGMASVRGLFNLDRPYNADELNAAYEALAKSVLLEQQKPNSAEPFILKGQIYAALKDNVRAKETLEIAVKIDPKNDFAKMRLGVVAYNDGNVELAKELLKEAASLNPKSKWSSLWQGVIASESGQIEEAELHFSKSLQIDPRFDLAFYNLGWTYLSSKPRNYEKAELNFRKALTLNPDYKEAFYGLGMVYGYQRQYKISANYLSKAIELDNSFLTAFKWRGIVNYELNEYEDALKDFSSATAIDPSNADIFVRRARVNIKTKNYKDGLNDLLLAKKLAPSNARIELYLARLYLDLNQFKSSLEAVNNAIALRESYSDAFFLRAELHQKQGNMELAVDDLNKALESTSYRTDRFHLKKGNIFNTMKNYKSALDSFISAREVNPESSEAWLQEVKVRLKLGQIEEAKKALFEFSKLEPNSDEIEILKNKLK
jgi:tetratricopeptide (TPR) repeat protein